MWGSLANSLVNFGPSSVGKLVEATPAEDAGQPWLQGITTKQTAASVNIGVAQADLEQGF